MTIRYENTMRSVNNQSTNVHFSLTMHVKIYLPLPVSQCSSSLGDEHRAANGDYRHFLK